MLLNNEWKNEKKMDEKYTPCIWLKIKKNWPPWLFGFQQFIFTNVFQAKYFSPKNTH